MIIPAVVEEVDAAVDGAANDAHAQRFRQDLEADMPTSQSDGRYTLSGPPEKAIRHLGRFRMSGLRLAVDTFVGYGVSRLHNALRANAFSFVCSAELAATARVRAGRETSFSRRTAAKAVSRPYCRQSKNALGPTGASRYDVELRGHVAVERHRA